MGNRWEYELRKMEIAWELAKRVLPTTEVTVPKKEQFKKDVEDALHWSVCAVADAFRIPSVEDVD